MKLFNLFKNRDLVKYSFKKNHGIPLFSDGMQNYIKLHRECGRPIDIENVNNNDNRHFEHDFIFKGVEYLNSIVNAPPLDKIKVCFEIIADNTVNAFAIEIIGCPTPIYLVAINSGLAKEYVDHFIKLKTIEGMIEDFDALTQVPIDFLKDAALAMSFCFIAFHELGHIYRGHLNYFREKYSSDFLHELSVNQFNIDDEDYNEVRHLFECDADAFAGSLMVGEILSRYKNGIESGLIRGDPKRLLKELTVFCGSVIHYIFCLFDRFQTEFDGWYPVPPIRTAIAMGHMAAQLTKEGLVEGHLNELLIDALIRAQGAVDESGMVQSTENLNTEFIRWSSKYRNKLSEVGKSLVAYVPI